MAAVYGSLKTRMFLDMQIIVSDIQHAGVCGLVAVMSEVLIHLEAERGIYPVMRGTREVPF